MQTQVLNKDQTLQKIKRLAWQIYEQHFEANSLVLAPINGSGEVLATMIAKELKLIGAPPVFIHTIQLDKSRPQSSAIHLLPELKETSSPFRIIIVDDVLNTGRTILYGLKPLMLLPLEMLQIAVLVDRGHHQFPLGADFIGYSLATTLQEHIRVSFEEEDFGVYLS